MLRQQYLSSAINVLVNSLKIYDHSKGIFFQQNLPEIHGEKDNIGALLLSVVLGTR